jgi:6-pyruvoyl-tetrahydropterin synthase
MKYLANTRLWFDAHHRIDDDEREGRDHGHRFTVSVTYEVPGDPSLATVDISAAEVHIEKVVSELDNRSLNAMTPIHPSVSGTARYFWERLAILIAGLVSIEVGDGTNSGIVTRDN